MAPRKVRLVVDLVRGLDVAKAQKQLRFSSKAAALPVLKVLNSALANAENNFHLDTSAFIITKAFVDGGPVMKRYTPKAHGRATTIRRRMSHITIEVGQPEQKKTDEKSQTKVGNLPELKSRQTKIKEPTQKKKI